MQKSEMERERESATALAYNSFFFGCCICIVTTKFRKKTQDTYRHPCIHTASCAKQQQQQQHDDMCQLATYMHTHNHIFQNYLENKTNAKRRRMVKKEIKNLI